MQQASKHPGEVVVLALAALTNVALALHLDPTLPEKLVGSCLPLCCLHRVLPFCGAFSDTAGGCCFEALITLVHFAMRHGLPCHGSKQVGACMRLWARVGRRGGAGYACLAACAVAALLPPHAAACCCGAGHLHHHCPFAPPLAPPAEPSGGAGRSIPGVR